MEHPSHVARVIKATPGLRRLAATLLTATALSIGLVAASAQAATSHHVASHHAASPLGAFPVVSSHHGAILDIPSCNPDPHFFCVWQNTGCTANPWEVPTADHSNWFRFSQTGVPYNPECVSDLPNASTSTVWVEDEQLEDGSNQCAVPGSWVTISGGQWGWFFVKFNIQSCGSEPGNETDGG